VTKLVLLAITAAALSAQVPAPASASAPTPRAFLDQYCIGCHNEKAKTAGLMLDKMDVSQVGSNPEVWEKVVRKLRAGMMPPAGMRRPEKPVIANFAGKLEADLDRSAATKPNPGAPELHRLNRTEYANAIRDLLSLEIEPTELLPADDSSAGFDNNADALGVSPALMERYLAAASKISRMAMGDATIAPGERTYAAANDLTQNYHVEGLPFGTRGGMLIRHNFPVDGEYTIAIELSRGGGGVFAGAGSTKGEELEISLNGERVKLFNLAGGKEPEEDTALPGLQVKVQAKAGMQTIGVTFVAKNYAPVEDTLQPYMRSMFPGAVWTVAPHVGSVTIKGPFKVAGVGDTVSRRQILTCQPANPQKELPCAKEIISTLARRAFRRPVTDPDLETLLTFYQAGRNKGSFDEGIEMALRRILASPEFMFRFEHEPNVKAGETYRISDVELASRLSFFLWSSIPDDELLKLASLGKLKDPVVLEQQVRRMLADPHSKELVRNFAGQWLYLRNLQSIAPAMEVFPDFDDNLRQAFRNETELFFDSIVREDHPILDLLTADYTFVDQRLAKHYGIPDIYGSQFRRVTLPADNPRRGLLGQGSILTATSLATRTSPVLRGKWILENILGTPPPEPPPNVPALKENAKPIDRSTETVEVPSVRQRMEEHRANEPCRSCHKMMDPIGFALENFDAVGQWRTQDGRTAVDPSGQLVDGTKIDGPAKLREALLGYSDQFLRTVTEKLLTYGLGRTVEYYDQPVVRSIVRDAARDNYRFSSVILGVVKSAPFQMRVKKPQQTAALATR